jgi:hypothetical protein
VDLVPASIVLNKENWNVGENITMDLTEQNIGSGTAGSHESTIYLSSDNILNSSGDVFLVSYSMGSMAGGAQQTVSRSFSVPNVPAGNYYLIVQVDDLNAVAETDESNNIGVRNGQVTISPGNGTPDLVVASVTVADGQGPDLMYSYTINNVGTADVSATFYNDVYLSTNTTISTTSDYLIDYWTHSETVAAGYGYTSTDLTTTVSGVPDGTYYLGIITDVTYVVTESNESNNTNYCASPLVTIGIPLPVPVVVTTGWNMVSIPVQATDMSPGGLFPTPAPVSSAYSYNNGYVTTSTLVVGKGYWLKFPSNVTYSIQGQAVTSKNITVALGWNLVGPFEQNVSVSNITSTPANIVASNYFGYSNGYTQASTLESGKGYWIKVDQQGTLNLPSVGSSPIPLAKTLSESQSRWTKIEVEDNAGMKGNLYLAARNEQGSVSELPPVPPSGVFDVRYGSNRQVESVETGRYEMYLSSASYPVKIRGENLGGKVYRVKDGVDGTLVQAELREGGEVTISLPLNRLTLEAIGMTEGMPLMYKLGQNYPNPFNPTTIIPFAVSQAGQVRIVVYNLLGEVIMELVNRYYEAGQYHVEFNASHLVSGIYYYRLQTRAFNKTQKMTLIR